MKTQILLLTFLMAIPDVQAQDLSLSLPKNPSPGWCYIKCQCLEKGKKIEGTYEWIKVRCDEIDKIGKNEADIIEYQEKLQKLEFNVDINGCLDQKTIEAHTEYQKILKKENRKKRRQQRRAKRKER